MYPIVYLYKKTSDKGRELKYSLRSLDNLQEWNGDVFVCGDAESWFSSRIVVIEPDLKLADRYQDQQQKLWTVIRDKRIPDDSILMNDDFFITKPSILEPMYDGKLEIYVGKNNWLTSKARTLAHLITQGATTLDYETHTPILLNKQKLKATLEIEGVENMQYRSVYGNTYKIGGKQYKDRKTRTSKLPKAPFISTRAYTPELDVLFPDKSEFEL